MSHDSCHLPCGIHPAQVTHDPWENPADERKFSLAQHASNSMAPDASSVSTAYSTVTADEESGGLEVKWHAHSDEPGRTLRADPLEWFRHHTSRLENESRGRTPAPLPETQFLRQLTSEHMSRDAALTDYKKMRESAEKRGELGELVPVRNLMRSWMPALEQAIANEQMLVRGQGSGAPSAQQWPRSSGFGRAGRVLQRGMMAPLRPSCTALCQSEDTYVSGTAWGRSQLVEPGGWA